MDKPRFAKLLLLLLQAYSFRKSSRSPNPPASKQERTRFVKDKGLQLDFANRRLWLLANHVFNVRLCLVSTTPH